jgi:hypothetical protein
MTGLWVLIVGLWVALLVLVLTGPSSNRAMAILIGVIALLTAVPMTVAVAEAFRFAAWLSGTTLAVRHLDGTRRCDLARSTVTLDRSRGVPRLTARDSTTGRRVRLLLGRPATRTLFEPPKLMALANSIEAGGRQDPQAWQVAASLRALTAPAPGVRPR